jgi:hypothetical protein
MGTIRSMSDATFITTIVSMCVAFLGAMGVIAHVLGARIGDVRIDLQASLADLREEMHAGFAAVRDETHRSDVLLRDEMRTGFAGVHARIDDQSARIGRVEQRLDGIAQTVAEHEGRLK